MRTLQTAYCTLNGDLFGEYDLALVYFKSPNKLRQETYLPRPEGEGGSFPSGKLNEKQIEKMDKLILTEQIQPTDIVISNSSTMTLINPATNEKFMEADLAQDAGMSPSQFTQMDLCAVPNH